MSATCFEVLFVGSGKASVMNDLIPGIIHVHSSFSSDGFCSVAELADLARGRGYDFLALTDHAEDLSSEDIKNLERECEKHSDEFCVIIPGLEFQCRGGIHILGLGFTEHIPSREPVAVATQIEAGSGLAILAHPSRSHYQCPPELFGVLSGIEIWNAAYDGRFVPSPASLRLLQKARNSNPAISGFGGADLHGLHRPPGVTLQLRVRGGDGISARMILQSLRSGAFAVRGRYIGLDAHGVHDWLTWSFLCVFRKSYELATAIRDIASGRA